MTKNIRRGVCYKPKKNNNSTAVELRDASSPHVGVDGTRNYWQFCIENN